MTEALVVKHLSVEQVKWVQVPPVTHEEFRRNLLGVESARGGRFPCTEDIAGFKSLDLHQ